MENFTAYNPTKLHFGREVTEHLGETVAEYGTRVLLMYGKGSIKKNGIYDKVLDQLKSINAEIIEYSGIKSNPLVNDVQQAAQSGKLNQIDLIVAVGGGSVIDSAKITALAIANNTDPWAIMKFKVKPKTNIPVIAVLTLAATGSEMNGAAVLQNHDTDEKVGFVSSLNFPKHSFLDPTYTFTVPRDYTAYGIVDLIAHSLEGFFGEGDATLTDRFVASIIKEAMEYGPRVLSEPENYEYRAKIMWAATTALNGLTNHGRKSGDWGVHDIGHNLSYLFDTPHGATLSIAYPAWLRLQKERIPDRIAKLGEHLFDNPSVDGTIERLENFFQLLGSPIKLADIGIGEDKKEMIIEQMVKTEANGMVHKLTDEDRKRMVEYMMG